MKSPMVVFTRGMGYIWRSTRNIILDDTLVHLAFRDVAPGAPRERVMVPCKGAQRETYFISTAGWAVRGAVPLFTRRPVTCVRCLGRPT